MSLHTINLKGELPYTKSPLDVPFIKKGWEKLTLSSDWKPWVQTVGKIFRATIAALASFIWVPIWMYSLTYCNLHAYRINKKIQVQDKQKQQAEAKAVEDKKIETARRLLIGKRVIAGAAAVAALAALTGWVFHAVTGGQGNLLFHPMRNFCQKMKVFQVLDSVKASLVSLPSKLLSVGAKAKELFANRVSSLPFSSIVPYLKTRAASLGELMGRGAKVFSALAPKAPMQELTAAPLASPVALGESIRKLPLCLPLVT